MNKKLLLDRIKRYLEKQNADPATYIQETKEREERTAYFQSWTSQRLSQMSPEEFARYLSTLWAMQIWGNKQYVADQLISNNGFTNLLKHISDLIWSSQPVPQRWDTFRSTIKGMGPAMMSELLCHVHPDDYMLWNRRAYVGLNYLQVPDLPRYDYQVNGAKYQDLCKVANEIAGQMTALGVTDVNLLTVDYFIWSELQVVDNLTDIHKSAPDPPAPAPVDNVDDKTATFIHNEVRDKIAEIGTWLGFQTKTECKVAEGAKVDAIWESAIGNLGRVIYAFEVQTKGSMDSLILNLIKTLNNAAVQAVVAVSDATQIAKIKAEAATVPNIKDKLKYWDYLSVLDVHEALKSVNEAINGLGLVPEGLVKQ